MNLISEIRAMHQDIRLLRLEVEQIRTLYLLQQALPAVTVDPEVVVLQRYRRAMTKLATRMEMNWGRHAQAGYRFPDLCPLIVSDREECLADDLVSGILEWNEEEDEGEEDA